MSLLSDDGSHICLACGHERQIADAGWLFDASDDTVFTSPPCPGCGAQESFCWHDEVPLRVVEEVRELPPESDLNPIPRKVRVQWFEPDPDGYEASHMRVIEDVAKKLNRQQKKIQTPERPSYGPKKPTKIGKAALREMVRKKAPQLQAPLEIMTKEKADRAYQEMVQVETERKSKKNASLWEEYTEALSVQQKDVHLPREQPIVMTPPQADSGQAKKVDNKPTPPE